MFCSKICRAEHNKNSKKNIVIDTYRTSTKHLSLLEIFYHNLAKKENFCIICGNGLKLKEKITNVATGVVFIFATIVPGDMILITSKPITSTITWLMK